MLFEDTVVDWLISWQDMLFFHAIKTSKRETHSYISEDADF